jgi:hypothetical protein
MDGDDLEKLRERKRLSKQKARAIAKERHLCTRCCKKPPLSGTSKKTGKPYQSCEPCIKWVNEKNAARHYKRKYGDCFLPEVLPKAPNVVRKRRPKKK